MNIGDFMSALMYNKRKYRRRLKKPAVYDLFCFSTIVPYRLYNGVCEILFIVAR